MISSFHSNCRSSFRRRGSNAPIADGGARARGTRGSGATNSCGDGRAWGTKRSFIFSSSCARAARRKWRMGEDRGVVKGGRVARFATAQWSARIASAVAAIHLRPSQQLALASATLNVAFDLPMREEMRTYEACLNEAFDVTTTCWPERVSRPGVRHDDDSVRKIKTRRKSVECIQSRRMHVGQPSQFSSFRLLTRLNSPILFVTSGRPKAIACAAMNKSFCPMGLPAASSSARMRP